MYTRCRNIVFTYTADTIPVKHQVTIPIDSFSMLVGIEKTHGSVSFHFTANRCNRYVFICVQNMLKML